MCGWVDQVGIRPTQLATGLKVEAELGKMQLKVFIGGVWAKFTNIEGEGPRGQIKFQNWGKFKTLKILFPV